MAVKICVHASQKTALYCFASISNERMSNILVTMLLLANYENFRSQEICLKPLKSNEMRARGTEGKSHGIQACEKLERVVILVIRAFKCTKKYFS